VAANWLETGIQVSSDDDSGSNTERPMRLATLYLMLADEGLHTASALGEATGASKRTVYRDIDRLRGAGLEIEGTSRLGYRLLEVPELSPLFRTRAERAALVAVAPAGLKAKLRGL
jgi:predicted DNA-binding transcriptional regulator YafY